MLIVLAVVAGVVIFVWAVKLTLLATSVGRYARYWHQQAATPQDGQQIQYIALGDSTAQAIGATSAPKGYVGLLAKSLAQKHGKPVHVTNLSVSGATVQDALQNQLPKLLGMNIAEDTVITIEIGANNMKVFREQEFAEQIDELFGKLPKQTVVSTVPYFGGGRWRMFEKNTQPANQILEAAAAKHGLRASPLYQITKERDGPWAYAADYFHPSNTGYRNWHDAFWQVLQN